MCSNQFSISLSGGVSRDQVINISGNKQIRFFTRICLNNMTISGGDMTTDVGFLLGLDLSEHGIFMSHLLNDVVI